MSSICDPFQIIIPTRNSGGWIGKVLDYYRSKSYVPLIVVDKRTDDNTTEIIHSKGFSYLEFLPNGDYPEAGMLEFAALQSESLWNMRLDDDELPSDSLLTWAREVGVKTKNQAWFIPRREIFMHKGELFYSRSFCKYPIPTAPNKLHPMARLYHAKRVDFLNELHTTGFRELKLYSFAPDNCYIAHFNCLLRSFEQRLEKVKLYEKIKPGSTWQLADEYLPEIFSLEHHLAKSVGSSEFDDFVGNIEILSNQPVLTREECDFAIKAVKDRAHKILRERNILGVRSNFRTIHLSADDFKWIELLPNFMRPKIIAFLCTILPKRLISYRDALWNYNKFVDYEK